MSGNKGVFIIGEIDGGKLAPITTDLLGVGRRLADELNQPLSAVFIGYQLVDAVREAIYYGADYVYLIDSSLLEDYLNDSYVSAIMQLITKEEPEVLLLGQTAMGKDLAPSLAFKLKTGVTLDCVKLSINPETKMLEKTKPIYGGNALATYVCEKGKPQIATIRLKAMAPLKRDESRKGDIVNFTPDIDKSNIRGRVVNKIRDNATDEKIEDANVVVCGGRGIGGAERFALLKDLASLLGGAVAATRPPCDAKWVSDNLQVGLTGRLIAPKVYIGIALSGASQHLAGMMGSKTIIAINKDPGANIFSVAHYGVVGQCEKILPAFIEKLRSYK